MAEAVRDVLARARGEDTPGGRAIDASELEEAWAQATAAPDPELRQEEADVFKAIDPGDLSRAGRRRLKEILATEIPNTMAAALSTGSRAEVLAHARGVLGYGNPRLPRTASVEVRPPDFSRHSFETATRRHDLWEYRDASVAVVTPNNARLRQETHGYGTDRPRDAWVTRPPPNGVLELTLHMTPSTHVGGTPEQMRDSFETFARQNTYVVLIELPDGRTFTFPADGKTLRNRPIGEAEYATWFDLSLPLLRGDTKISAWPVGSAGVQGYVERRQTVIHY